VIDLILRQVMSEVPTMDTLKHKSTPCILIVQISIHKIRQKPQHVVKPATFELFMAHLTSAARLASTSAGQLLGTSQQYSLPRLRALPRACRKAAAGYQWFKLGFQFQQAHLASHL
jgi:hypothetical protein